MKKDWTYKKLGEVGTVVTGSTPSTKDNMNYSSQDVCFFKPSDLSSDSLVKLSKSEFYISKHAFEHSRKLPKGSVLTTCIGIIGKVGILTEKATCNQQINAIIPNPNIITSNFLGYSIMSKKHVLQAIANAPVVPLLNKTQFSNFSIPIPPLSIQRSIVAELDLLHSVIEKKQEQLRALDNLAQSLFYQMFGDPITNPMGWEVKKLGEVAPVKPCQKEIHSENGLFWLLNLDMVESQTGKIIEKNMVTKEEIGNSTTSFSPDNVLYSKLRPYLNKVVLPNNYGYCTTELLPLLPMSGILTREYLCYLLRSNTFVEYINIKVAGAKMPRVTMNDFRNFPLPLPPLSLQQSFAAKVSAIEAQKQAITQSIKDVESLLAQRMDHYF